MDIKFKHLSSDYGTKHEVIAIITTTDGVVHRICADVTLVADDELPTIEAREGKDWERRRLVNYKRLARQLLRAKAIQMFSRPA